MRGIDVVALVILGLCLIPDVILWVLVFDNDRRPRWVVEFEGDKGQYELKMGAKWWEPLWLAQFWTGTLTLMGWAWVLHYYPAEGWALIEADPIAAIVWPPLLALLGCAPLGYGLKVMFPYREPLPLDLWMQGPRRRVDPRRTLLIVLGVATLSVAIPIGLCCVALTGG